MLSKGVRPSIGLLNNGPAINRLGFIKGWHESMGFYSKGIANGHTQDGKKDNIGMSIVVSRDIKKTLVGYVARTLLKWKSIRVDTT